jgi:Transposase DDE domain
MHAISILQNSLADTLATMHAYRVQALLGAVSALLLGRRLVLMDLARSWPQAQRVRAPLKRIDRLLSNHHLVQERVALYAAMALRLVRGRQPVIIVDWSPLDARNRFHLLRAGIAVHGRTVTLFESVHTTAELSQPRVERAFLQALKRLLPSGCQPIIVTDAGFRVPWFQAVRALGWDYVGRVRGTVTLCTGNGQWQRISVLHAVAKRRALRLPNQQLRRSQPWSCDLIVCRRQHQHRQQLNNQGLPTRNSRSRKAQRRGREPWVLATSLDCSPNTIVALYAQRMQIEQSFRDLKCDRFGCAFAHTQTRSAVRLELLLLIHALAVFVAYLLATRLRARDTTLIFGGVSSARRHYSWLRLAFEALRKTTLRVAILTQLLDPPDPHSPRLLVRS